MCFPVVMATAEITRAFIPLVASVMALDLVRHNADLDDHDAVVVTLIKLGHSARAVSQCFTTAISKAKEAKNHAARIQSQLVY